MVEAHNERHLYYSAMPVVYRMDDLIMTSILPGAGVMSPYWISGLSGSSESWTFP